MSVRCFFCQHLGQDQTLLWRSPGYCPVKMKPDQREVFLLLLGLPINPLYLELARKSPLLVPSRLQGCSNLSFPQSFLQTLQRDYFPPSDHLVSYEFCFPPVLSSLFSSCQATCVTRVSGKKCFKTHWHASPKSIFGEPSFFFFKTKKPQGKIGNTGVKGSVSHLARPASCPSPPTSQPQHYGERVWLRQGRRSVFPAKPRPKLWTLILALVT